MRTIKLKILFKTLFIKKLRRTPSDWYRNSIVIFYILEFLLWMSVCLKFLMPLVNKFYYKIFAYRKYSITDNYEMLGLQKNIDYRFFECAIPV